MLLSGILSIIQTVFLPGCILMGAFNIKTTSTIQKWIYVFAFSLFFNYALVTLLTLLGIYKALLIYAIFIIEIIVLIYLLRTKKFQIDLSINIRKAVNKYFSFLNSLSKSGKTLIIIVFIIVLFYFSLFIANLGTIFYFVDTVNNIHWNTWAMDFANNSLPKLSSHFPQLIPANWSLSYVMIGKTNVHFFPKSYMPLFFFSNLLMFLDLGLSKKNNVYFFSLITYGLFAPIIYSLVFIADGNGDLPVSFFTFLSFYAYLKSDKEKFILKEYLLIFLFASTAAGTKLAGFYVFFFMSLLCLYQLLKNIKSLNTKKLSAVIFFVILVLSINLFWYLLKPETMAGGLDQPEWLAEGYSNILMNAAHSLYYNIGLPVIAFFILTILFSLFVKESRFITILFVIPPIILWMFKYSADFRNLSFVVPFLSYVSAFGLEKIYQIIRDEKSKIVLKTIKPPASGLKKKSFLFTLCCFLSFLILFFLINTDTFYQVLYSIYSAVNKFYFQSNRIVYFIDYTFFVHVDYYQKVLAVMFLVLSATSLLYIFRIKLRDMFVILVAISLFLNFTVITRDNILNHQRTEFEKVDARNYYQTISTIVKSAKLGGLIITNFNAICYEKIPRDITFIYKDADYISNALLTSGTTKTKLYFIKLNQLQTETKEMLSKGISNKNLESFYDDGDYLLLKD